MKWTVVEEREGITIVQSEGNNPKLFCSCPFCFSLEEGGGIIVDGACSSCGRRAIKLELWQEKFPEFAESDDYELVKKKYRGAAPTYKKKAKPQEAKKDPQSEIEIEANHPLSKLLT